MYFLARKNFLEKTLYNFIDIRARIDIRMYCRVFFFFVEYTSKGPFTKCAFFFKWRGQSKAYCYSNSPYIYGYRRGTAYFVNDPKYYEVYKRSIVVILECWFQWKNRLTLSKFSIKIYRIFRIVFNNFFIMSF